MSSRHTELVLAGFAGAGLLFLVLLMIGGVSCESLERQNANAELSAVGVSGFQNGLPPYQIPEPSSPESGLAELSLSERSIPVAVINGVTIPLAELQDRMDKQSPYVRAKYAAPEKRKEILDQLIDLEVLAQAAAEAGYASHPDVLRQMKQAMIQKFIDGTFSKQFTLDSAVSEEEIAQYYKEHEEEYNKPEQVRVSHILVADRASAEQLMASAKAQKNNPRFWKELVEKNTLDPTTKAKSGDLGYFAKNTTEFEATLVNQAFALQANGDMAVVETPKGWHLIKLTSRRKALSRSQADVSTQIRQKLFSDKRKLEFERFKGEIREKSQVTSHYQKLDALKLNVTEQSGAAPPNPGLRGGVPSNPNAPAGIQEALRQAQERAKAKALENANAPGANPVVTPKRVTPKPKTGSEPRNTPTP